MKKFVFIIDDLYGGGAEKVLLTVASGLADRACNVEVWLLRDKIEHQVPNNIKLKKLNLITPFTKAFNNLITRSLQAKKVQKRIDEAKADVLICCASENITALVYHPNQYFWLHADYGNIKRKYINKIKKFYRDRNIICVSKGVEKSIFKLGVLPKTSQVLWNPIDYSLIHREAEIPSSTYNRSYFICVASLEIRKGHCDLLKAFALSDVSDDLFLIGKGPELQHLQEYAKALGIEKQVHFKGFMKNPYPYIKNAKALLLTSRNEGLSLVLIEALMLGTDIAAMDCPSGPKEVLEYANLSKNLFTLGDIDGFAKCIQRLSLKQENIEQHQYMRFLPDVALKYFELL